MSPSTKLQNIFELYYMSKTNAISQTFENRYYTYKAAPYIQISNKNRKFLSYMKKKRMKTKRKKTKKRKKLLCKRNLVAYMYKRKFLFGIWISKMFLVQIQKKNTFSCAIRLCHERAYVHIYTYIYRCEYVSCQSKVCFSVLGEVQIKVSDKITK